MRRVALIAGMLLLLPVATGQAQPRSVPRPHASFTKRGVASSAAQWVPGRVLVRWNRGIGAARARSVAAAADARVVDRVAMGGVDVLRTRAGVIETVKRLTRARAVRVAQPDYLLFSSALPTDPRLDAQWGLINTGQLHPVTGSTERSSGRDDADIDGEAGWLAASGAPVLAVLDSGVDVSHPDLDDNLWSNPDEVPGNAVDDDGNGLVDDVHGWDFARDRADLFEENGLPGHEHGTHVAGIAAAETDNATGIAGVCASCRIMVLKFMRPTDTDGDGVADVMAGRTSAELDALAYARSQGADVLNASFGSPAWSRLERDGFKRLSDAGTLAVVAAGNLNGDNDMFLFADFDGDGFADAISPSYPASYDLNGIISVAASNDRDRYGYGTKCASVRGARWPCTFTSWGRVSVDLAAPGVDVLSTVQAPSYDVFDGTSMASPHVAATAALLSALHPGWGPSAIKNAITSTVDKPDGLDTLRAIPGHPVFDGGLSATNGRLSLAGALSAPWPGSEHDSTDGTVKGADKLRGRRGGGKLGWPRDVNDVFKKRLKKGRRYSVSLEGPRGEDFDLVVYKPGTKEIWQIEPSCVGGGGPSCKLVAFRATRSSDESARFEAKTSGKYVFQVSSFFGDGRYRLRVKHL